MRTLLLAGAILCFLAAAFLAPPARAIPLGLALFAASFIPD